MSVEGNVTLGYKKMLRNSEVRFDSERIFGNHETSVIPNEVMNHYQRLFCA